MIQVNIGCGQTPTPGWKNYDNSPSVRLAKYPALVLILDKLGLLKQKSFVLSAMSNDILWADATKHIPLPDGSVGTLYSSHMVEHLEREQARLFLKEARRLLASGGIIRVAVPDLRKLVNRYIAEGDADAFVERTHLAQQRPKTVLDRLGYLISGTRCHLWMYDGPSMGRLLLEAGFREPRVLEPGSTTIPNPGKLDLYERAGGSVYVEAYKP